MKKITILLCSILLLVITGCEKKVATSGSNDGGSYSELIKMGKYIGMTKNNVTSDLNNSNWKWTDSCPYTSNGAYSKKISGHDVYAYIDYMEDNNLCYVLSFFIVNESDFYNQTVSLYKGIGETYTFVNGGNISTTVEEAPFSRLDCLQNESSLNYVTTYSYTSGKKMLSDNVYYYVGAQWLDDTLSRGKAGMIMLYFDSNTKNINLVYQVQ